MDKTTGDADPPQPPDRSRLPTAAGQSGDGVNTETREQKLQRIRRQVEAGEYDSDDLLERALKIMLNRMADDED